MQYHSLIMCLL